MTIEIIVGLPHLGRGPLLDRAIARRYPVLISANALSRWDRRGGYADPVRRNLARPDHRGLGGRVGG
jgi:hypothetical protein